MSENSVTQVNLYKVLRDGKSCHGGSLTWPLPTQRDDGSWTPGEWVKLDNRRKLALCENAIHLTDQPASWYLPDAQCWLAEYRGETSGELSGRWGSKIGVRKARLLRPVAWDDVAVWSSGDHTLRTGVGRAYDSATVRASDSATVRAYDSATVVSTLWHSDSAQVALNQMAAHVDRRGGKVVCRVAEAAS